MSDEGPPRDEKTARPERPLTLEPEAPPARGPVDEEPLRLAPPKGGGVFGRLARTLAVLFLVIFLVGPIMAVATYRFVPPPVTFLMIQRLFEGQGLDRRWRSLDDISPRLVRSVIAAEDARFCEHRGFDFEAMEKALAHNERRPTRIRGGSTISQQTAKNIFLWPQRSYVRKGLEAGFAVLIEGLWGKRRIMEVYLNSVEWGPGVYGAEAAARHWFGVSADELSATQAARLAAILPSPLRYKAANPGPYVRRRARSVAAQASSELSACVTG